MKIQERSTTYGKSISISSYPIWLYFLGGWSGWSSGCSESALANGAAHKMLRMSKKRANRTCISLNNTSENDSVNYNAGETFLLFSAVILLIVWLTDRLNWLTDWIDLLIPSTTTNTAQTSKIWWSGASKNSVELNSTTGTTDNRRGLVTQTRYMSLSYWYINIGWLRLDL